MTTPNKTLSNTGDDGVTNVTILQVTKLHDHRSLIFLVRDAISMHLSSGLPSDSGKYERRRVRILYSEDLYA